MNGDSYRRGVIEFNLFRKTSAGRVFVRGPLRMTNAQWDRLRVRLNADSPRGTRYEARNTDQDGPQLRFL